MASAILSPASLTQLPSGASGARRMNAATPTSAKKAIKTSLRITLQDYL